MPDLIPKTRIMDLGKQVDMRIFIIVIFCSCIVSCSPDQDPISQRNECSLEDLIGQPYVGIISICNGIPDHQSNFPGIAEWVMVDSLIMYNIQSSTAVGNNTYYTFTTTLIERCELSWNNQLVHVLYDPQINENVGELKSAGKELFLFLKDYPCYSHTIFNGIIQ